MGGGHLQVGSGHVHTPFTYLGTAVRSMLYAGKFQYALCWNFMCC